ncbi:MAG: hypothetical protein ACLPHP_07450 [Candidatus Sulfotelmatobacter sp.]
MGNRSRLWIVASLLVGCVIIWAVGQAVNPSSGDVEFKKTLESIKQVKSFRGAYIESASTSQQSERLWEVDCNQVIVHQQSHDAQSNPDAPFEVKEEELLVGDQRYTRDRDGSWENNGYAGERYSAKWYCDNLARGTVRDLLPDMYTMVSHAMTEKGDKKTVNGARCQEWKFAVRTAVLAQDGSMCIGLDDHLPYEMTMKNGGHYSYSDYNRPIQFEVPAAVLQPASSTAGSN